ncbi:MAG: alpha/beta fold hydrolase [Actinobacteria bacterium]|nr:alpha/beta fold hydrolase [Actinomycetota bacterium]
MRAGTRSVIVTSVLLAVIAAGCSTDAGVRVTDRSTATDDSASPDDTAPDDSAPDDSAPDTTGGSSSGGTIDWEPCDDESATDEALECATLAVPLDHNAPDGDTIDLALVRAPATSDRQGAILMNPGGPGGSGFDFIAMNGTGIQSQMGLDGFDIVGFDPRGVDRSNGIRCVDDAFIETHLYLDDTPDTPEEQALLDEDTQGFVDGCKERYGDTLQFYSTDFTARDMDLIREGMGDEQISYLGISYGTYLGAVYATLFPDRVRAMVLDSAYEPNGDTVEEQYLTQIVGFEGAFNDWAKWCQDDAGCPFNAADVGARWDALRVQLDENPITVESGRVVNQSTLDVATSAALYSEASWPVLADALAKAETGDGEGILSMADDYKGRNADGTFDTLFQSIGIIECASGIEQAPPDDPDALLAKIKEQAPRWGADVTLEDLTDTTGDCADLMPDQDIVELDYSGDGPIVVVGGTNDPATPIRWAEEMTAALGANARLVTFTGEGHGQLLASKCVTEAESAVLIDLTLPDEGTVCDPDPVVERPTWWDTLPTIPGEEAVELPAVSAALGLSDTLGYGETRVTAASMEDADAAWATALADAGFMDLGVQDIGIDGTLEHGYFSPEGELLALIFMSPEAFDTDALSSAKSSVPEGKTVLLLVYLPQ